MLQAKPTWFIVDKLYVLAKQNCFTQNIYVTKPDTFRTLWMKVNFDKNVNSTIDFTLFIALQAVYI